MTDNTPLSELVNELKHWQQHQWLGKSYAECSLPELRLVLDNLESLLSPECLSDYHQQTGRDPEPRRQAIRMLWKEIESTYKVHKPISHKW